MHDQMLQPAFPFSSDEGLQAKTLAVYVNNIMLHNTSKKKNNHDDSQLESNIIIYLHISTSWAVQTVLCERKVCS